MLNKVCHVVMLHIYVLYYVLCIQYNNFHFLDVYNMIHHDVPPFRLFRACVSVVVVVPAFFLACFLLFCFVCLSCLAYYFFLVVRSLRAYSYDTA